MWSLCLLTVCINRIVIILELEVVSGPIAQLGNPSNIDVAHGELYFAPSALGGSQQEETAPAASSVEPEDAAAEEAALQNRLCEELVNQVLAVVSAGGNAAALGEQVKEFMSELEVSRQTQFLPVRELGMACEANRQWEAYAGTLAEKLEASESQLKASESQLEATVAEIKRLDALCTQQLQDKDAAAKHVTQKAATWKKQKQEFEAKHRLLNKDLSDCQATSRANAELASVQQRLCASVQAELQAATVEHEAQLEEFRKQLSRNEQLRIEGSRMVTDLRSQLELAKDAVRHCAVSLTALCPSLRCVRHCAVPLTTLCPSLHCISDCAASITGVPLIPVLYPDWAGGIITAASWLPMRVRWPDSCHLCCIICSNQRILTEQLGGLGWSELRGLQGSVEWPCSGCQATGEATRPRRLPS